MSTSLLKYFNIRRLPTGRLLFVLNDIRQVAVGLHLQGLVTEVDEAIAHAKKTLELELQWRTRKSDPSKKRGDASIIDSQIDTLLGGIQSIVSGQSVGDESDPAVPAARRFLSSIFPLGLGGITNQSFEQQLGYMDAMQLRFANELKDDVKTLGLGAKLSQLSTLVEAFRKELEKTRNEITWNSVVAAQNEGHELLADLFVSIFACHKKRDPETLKRRAALLAEYDRQDRIVYEAQRRRRKVLDVDPDTGLELPSDDALPAVEEDAA